MDIRDSLQVILATGKPQFSERFYSNFFGHYPEIEKKFDAVDLKRQGIMLTMALQVVVEHYLRPHLTMKNYLRLLGHKHLSTTQQYARVYDATVQGQFQAAMAKIEGIPISDWPQLTGALAQQPAPVTDSV